MMVAIPELDGATGPMVFGGRSERRRRTRRRRARDMQPCTERGDMLAARVGKLVDLRRSERAAAQGRRSVLFNFPPNAGNTGTAAFLSVFESLHNMLQAMQREGYTVEVPATRRRAARARHPRQRRALRRAGQRACAHRRRRPRAARALPQGQIEAQWGPAPGRQQSDGSSHLRARRALRQRLRRHPAGLRLRRRPDAPAVREGLRADACLLGLLPLAARRLRRPRGAALRHARRARVHARQAGRPVRRLLARPADRRPAELLPLRVQQPVARARSPSAAPPPR